MLFMLRVVFLHESMCVSVGGAYEWEKCYFANFNV